MAAALIVLLRSQGAPRLASFEPWDPCPTPSPPSMPILFSMPWATPSLPAPPEITFVTSASCWPTNLTRNLITYCVFYSLEVSADDQGLAYGPEYMDCRCP